MQDAVLHSMVWLVATQFLLYAVGWVACGLFLREQRRAVVHWGAFMACVGLGFLLSTQRGEPRSWWAFNGADLVFIGGLLALWRGLEAFYGLAARSREQAALLAAVALAMLALGPQRELAAWRVMAVYAALTVLTLRMLQVLNAASRKSYSPRVARWLALPGYLIALAFMVAIVRQAMNMGLPLEVHRFDANNTRALFVFIAAAAMFNFTFVALLTLRLVRRLRELSRHDPLTGLLNRRALEDRLQREWQRWRRGGAPFAILALDLDHFKAVNDTHGHLAGDAVLEQTGRRLAAVARGTDTVARSGGEEFIVLAPQVQAEGALALAERMRAAVGGQAFTLQGGQQPLTVSVGLALVDAGDTELHLLMQRADQALYRAKAAGRNRVALAPPPAEPAAAAQAVEAEAAA